MPTTYEVNSRETWCSSSPAPAFERPRPVFEIDPLRDPRWKALAGSHPNASVFHQVEWLQALNSCYGYMPVALTSSPPESPLENGLLYCEVRSPFTGKRLVSIPFSDHCEPLVGSRIDLDVFLAYLARKVDQNRWRYFELRPILHSFDHKRSFGVSQSYYYHRLDIRASEQELFRKLHKDSVQRKIRRAEREGLRTEVGASQTLLSHFYKLMIITRRRQGLPPQPLNWFRSVISSMGANAQIRVAFKEETPVASILTLTTRRTLVYKYGCSDGHFSNLGGTALLFWNAIRQAKTEGIQELDLGRSDIGNAGLIRFKEQWGAERSSVNYWRYPLRAASSNPERLIRHAKKLISIAPDRALVLLGNLLYRHVG